MKLTEIWNKEFFKNQGSTVTNTVRQISGRKKQMDGDSRFYDHM
jgi:hypothetical protein